IPPNYLQGAAAAGGIGVISSLGQVGAFFAPIVLGWVKSVTGSFSGRHSAGRGACFHRRHCRLLLRAARAAGAAIRRVTLHVTDRILTVRQEQE
ncbi:hypothetical protein M3654_24100, partial [Bacillus licheniformis]|nr:hypothetical protein [Bacillus licheniformis]